MTRNAGLFLLLALFAWAGSAAAADARREPFGELADGRRIESVTLANAAGMSVRLMTLGATIQSIVVPDRDGHLVDVVLGYDSAREYLEKPNYFGATVGRYANRIADARFSLDGRVFNLSPNDHGNSLHGGRQGFDKVIWKIDSVQSGPRATAAFSYVSPDGEEGYPGTLRVTATYSLDEHDTLHLEFEARTDKPTVVNISNHSYFNLSGGSASIMEHLLEIHASRFTPVGDTLIPTGELRNVAGTPFDFRSPTAIGQRIRDGRDAQLRAARGYDHNYALDGKAGEMRMAARISDPLSGRVMTLYTTAPGLQFYSGNFLNATLAGKGSRLYRQGDALALEPQFFPDTPNQPAFGSARLDPGATYRSGIEYRFSVELRSKSTVQ
jgi:aldose 1-epimerase